MNDPQITFTKVPWICKGRITSQIKESETYEVQIYSSPLGSTSGPIYASIMYPPGTDNNYKQGDYVNIQVILVYDSTGKCQGFASGSANYILGLFNERSVANIKIENPLTQSDNDRVVFKNKHSQAGLAVSDSGEVILASGAMHILLKAFGYGMYADTCHITAQNHHRVIGNAPPYLSREHFGMFSGSSEEDKVTRTTDEDYYINYRRFVTKTLSPDHWVSTCEGAYCPWVGANNESDFVEASKEVLLSKIINHGNSRITIEMGEPGNSFVYLRIDDVKVCEKTIINGATPVKLGNRFNLKISDKGAVEMFAGGNGLASKANFKLTIKENGELIINAANKITLTHGDSDTSINSIILDPNNGIDVTAKNGFRVNGQPLVNKKYLDWMIKYQAALCQTIAMGTPSPINPVAFGELNGGYVSTDTLGGFTTKDIGLAASGIIKEIDDYS